MRKLNRGLFLALICSMALAGCGNSANSAAETENENTVSENTVVSENENIPLNFNLKITDARTDGDELSIMYLVSIPSNDRPAADMEFEKTELMTADGNTADCEFDGVELYSDNGQDSVYTIDYKFNGEVPAGNYELKFENYGYYESESFNTVVEGSWTRNCVVGSDKTSAAIDVSGQKIDENIELTQCELKQTSILIKYKYTEETDFGKVQLNFTDGETMEVSNTTDKTVSSEESTNEATAIINFNEMIDINEVESVDIMGKIFEI